MVPVDLRRVRDVLVGAGYTDAGIHEVLGDDLPPRLGAARIPALLRRTAAGTPREIFVRLFILGATVGRDDVERAVAPMGPATWVDLGLLEPKDGGLAARLTIRCYQQLLVASDFGRDVRGELSPDWVMGVSGSTLGLIGFTIRRPVTAALDLGSGSGLQAFLAAAHSHRVVAVDRNPRAVRLAELNVALNGLDNVECREGDLFGPVEGERFDLIVSNPPFVIAPDFRYYFLHSGLPGDELCRRIVQEAPRFLTEGGFCQLQANWVVAPGERWWEPVARWVEGSGCDVWVLSRGLDSAGAYAADWAEPNADEPAALAASVEQTLSAFESAGIRTIASGMVTMRRRAGDNWFRPAAGPETMAFPCGDDVLRIFDVHDALDRLEGDRALLDLRLRLGPDVRLSQELQAAGGSWAPVAWEIHRTDGFRWRGSLDASGAHLLAQCDGTRPLGQLVAEMAGSLGVDPEAVAAKTLPIFRRLLEQGFLVGELSRPGGSG